MLIFAFPGIYDVDYLIIWDNTIFKWDLTCHGWRVLVSLNAVLARHVSKWNLLAVLSAIDSNFLLYPKVLSY